MEYCQLAQGERYAMANMMHRGYSYREIARILGRSVSTISREKRRNLTQHDGRYRAEQAHQYAMARRSRSRKQDQYSQEEWEEVAGLVQRKWSPEQIARRLRRDFPDDESMRISHEAIYQALYVQGRGALRRELTACLRTGRALRVPRARTRGRGKRFVTPEILISQRPAEAADRAVPGHWEGDLILGWAVPPLARWWSAPRGSRSCFTCHV